jgi:hypothetical protein
MSARRPEHRIDDTECHVNTEVLFAPQGQLVLRLPYRAEAVLTLPERGTNAPDHCRPDTASP